MSHTTLLMLPHRGRPLQTSHLHPSSCPPPPAPAPITRPFCPASTPHLHSPPETQGLLPTVPAHCPHSEASVFMRLCAPAPSCPVSLTHSALALPLRAPSAPSVSGCMTSRTLHISPGLLSLLHLAHAHFIPHIPHQLMSSGTLAPSSPRLAAPQSSTLLFMMLSW